MTRDQAERLLGAMILLIKRTGPRGGTRWVARAARRDTCPHCGGRIDQEYFGEAASRSAALARLVRLWKDSV